MDILSFDNDTLKLNSGILEENFGKMSFSSIITETGLFVKVSKENDQYSFDYSEWAFNDVQSFDTENGRKVFYCGESPFKTKAQTLLDLLEGENAFNAGLTVIRILTDAALSGKSIPLTGAGGILIESENSQTTVLFVPERLFSGAVAGLNEEEKARQIFLWQNPTLFGNQALRFARSNLAYRILTGKLPFPMTNTIERNADILDKNYLPLELCIPSINSELAIKINSELELNSAKVNIPGKKEKKSLSEKINEGRAINETDAQRAQRLQAEYIKGVSKYPFELLENTKPAQVTDEVFKSKAQDYMAKKSHRIKAKRRIRRNTGTIITVLLISAVVGFLTVNSIKSNELNKTSKGLTAEQTVEAFYESINLLDTMFLSDHSKGKTASNYANIVSQMYVIGKNRQAYSRDRGIQNPSAYFLSLKNDTEIEEGGLFGITNLEINGSLKNMNLVIPVEKDKPVPIKEDKGIAVYKKMNSVQEVSFYMIHTEGSEIYCEKQTDTVTLTFEKNKWIVTDISTVSEQVEINSQDFFSKYFTLIEMTGGDPQACVRIMKSEYPWLPNQKSFEVELLRKKEEQAQFMSTFGIN